MSDYNLCPKCGKLWYLVNQKGDFKILSFAPITKNTEHKICPKCKDPEKYNFEKVRCFECNEWFKQKIGEEHTYCPKHREGGEGGE